MVEKQHIIRFVIPLNKFENCSIIKMPLSDNGIFIIDIRGDKNGFAERIK